MIKFDYHEPTTLKKTFSLMEKHGEDARVIAGGTSLIIMMRQRLLMPKIVISLARIPKLDRITYNSNNGLRIGAGARHRDIELSVAVQKHYPLLHETFRKVAQPRIRNMGTIGGNLAGGDPLTDPGASLIALDAEVTLSSSKGQRRLRLDEFNGDPGPATAKTGLVPHQVHPAQHRGLRDGRSRDYITSQERYLRGCPPSH